MKSMTFESAKTEYSATLCKLYNANDLMRKDLVAKFFEVAVEAGGLLDAFDFVKNSESYKKYLNDLAIKLSQTLYTITFLVNCGEIKAKRVKKFLAAAEFLLIEIKAKYADTTPTVYNVKEVNPTVVPAPVVQAPKPVIIKKQNAIKSVVAPPISANESVQFQTSTGEVTVIKQDRSAEAKGALPCPKNDGLGDEYSE